MLLLLSVFFYNYFSLSFSLLLSLPFYVFLLHPLSHLLSPVLFLSLTFSVSLTHFSSPVILSLLCVLPTSMNLFSLISPGVSFSFSLSPFFSSDIYHFCFHSPFVFDLMKSAKLETSPSVVCRLCGVVLGTI